MCEFATARSSCPSRAALFIDSMAMKPLAPGLFSTTTCFPQSLESFSAMRRMKIDGATPAECGMVIRTVRVGKDCAPAGPAASSRAVKRLSANQQRRRKAREELRERELSLRREFLAGKNILQLSAQSVGQ